MTADDWPDLHGSFYFFRDVTNSYGTDRRLTDRKYTSFYSTSHRQYYLVSSSKWEDAGQTGIDRDTDRDMPHLPGGQVVLLALPRTYHTSTGGKSTNSGARHVL